eukprot:768822-Hanusia_phi.AAC.10
MGREKVMVRQEVGRAVHAHPVGSAPAGPVHWIGRWAGAERSRTVTRTIPPHGAEDSNLLVPVKGRGARGRYL